LGIHGVCKAKDLGYCSFAEHTIQTFEQIGELNADDIRQMLSREEFLKALEVGASGLFVDFLLENQEILAEQSLIHLVQEKQKKYPLG